MIFSLLSFFMNKVEKKKVKTHEKVMQRQRQMMHYDGKAAITQILWSVLKPSELKLQLLYRASLFLLVFVFTYVFFFFLFSLCSLFRGYIARRRHLIWVSVSRTCELGCSAKRRAYITHARSHIMHSTKSMVPNLRLAAQKLYGKFLTGVWRFIVLSWQEAEI